MPLPRTLSLQALNRATLARQLLLERANAPVVEAIERLAGMQAQIPKPPFVGLWSRLADFRRSALFDALHRRTIVRATMMRGTLHYMSAEDYLGLRPALSDFLAQALRATLRTRLDGLDVAGVVEAARGVFAEHPHTFTALRDRLMERFTDADERVLGFTARMHLPLVMVPDGSAWGYPADAAFTLAEGWLSRPMGTDEGPSELVRRYLAAFGPATVADAQAWSGLKGLKETFEALRPELVTFRDARKREFFDLPDAPRPAEDVPAPARFLPEYDNLVLAHADRTRLVADVHRPRIVTKNLKVLATFLIDGAVAGTWRIERKAKAATLVVEPFEPLSASRRDELEAEGEGLLRFCEEEARTQDIRFASP
ncbi:MAG TPA: winged helix DNA-binding domain-containing protein [Pantanalinema sp.]